METNFKSKFKETMIANTTIASNTKQKLKETNSFSYTHNLNNINKILSSNYPNYKIPKTSTKSIGKIKSHSANSYIGLIRNYNEDRIKIINKVTAPNSRSQEDWPDISYFAIYDGHAGNKCANFLKENLHNFIFRQKCFPESPKKAIYKGFRSAEKEFFLENKPVNVLSQFDRSGSCALVIIIIGDMCYVANLGDSRALLSEQYGKKLFVLSKDHKPDEENEKKRIYANGGRIYQGTLNNNGDSSINYSNHPFRIFPGKLSVSRAFGDLEAKIPEVEGNPNVLIAVPEIRSFKITKETDFIVMGSDGVFEKLQNFEIMQNIWICLNENINSLNCAQKFTAGNICDLVLKLSMSKYTQDNISCIFISFRKFRKKNCDQTIRVENEFLYKEDIDEQNECPDKSLCTKDGVDSYLFNTKVDRNKNFNISYSILADHIYCEDLKMKDINLKQDSVNKFTKTSNIKKVLNKFKIDPKVMHISSNTSFNNDKSNSSV